MTLFTEEYRNQHWKPCRYGLDPRNCGRFELRPGRDGSKEEDWKPCFVTHGSRKCPRDGADCDARWNKKNDVL